MSGRDALASYATPLEGWVSKGQTPDAQRVSALTGALQNTAAHDPPLFITSKMTVFKILFHNHEVKTK
jgi:hypothetical protein